MDQDDKRRWIAIDQCPNHGTLSVSLDNWAGGTKLVRVKCCGRWELVKRWEISAEELRELANEFECAAGEMEP